MNTLLCATSQLLTPSLPVGQAHFDRPGTYHWICPEGVTEVSVAMVGGGGSGESHSNVNSRYCGQGGHLRWKNNVKVVPGQTYSIRVGESSTGRYNTSSSALGISTLTGVGGSLNGENGGPSILMKDSGYRGGNAGGAGPSGYSGRGLNLKTWTPQAGSGFQGGKGGGGGSADHWQSGLGGPGAVRIIWGEGRAFPNLNIGDM